MPSKNVTMNVDEVLYDKYREFCKKKDWIISRVIRNYDGRIGGR